MGSVETFTIGERNHEAACRIGVHVRHELLGVLCTMVTSNTVMSESASTFQHDTA